MSREIHYTFVLTMAQEDEEFEGEFEDGLTNILETAGYIGTKTAYDIDLHKKVIVPRGAPGCTCGTPPFAPPEPSDDCPFHGPKAAVDA